MLATGSSLKLAMVAEGVEKGDYLERQSREARAA
jgi:hypothetical protein